MAFTSITFALALAPAEFRRDPSPILSPLALGIHRTLSSLVRIETKRFWPWIKTKKNNGLIDFWVYLKSKASIKTTIRAWFYASGVFGRISETLGGQTRP
jgi:hypothetical protein